MEVLGLGVLMVLALACSIGALVSAAKHRPPVLDRATAHRLTTALNRGRLPALVLLASAVVDAFVIVTARRALRSA